jgi:gluconate 2-dehydrogenase
MRKKVLVVNRLEKEALERLELHADVFVFTGNATLDNPDFKEKLQDAEGITGLGLPVNAALLDAAPKLKIVSNVSVGHNNLDLKEMTKRGVLGTNTPGVLSNTVADLVFGLLLSTARRLPELDHYVKKGKWRGDLRADFYGMDVHHKTIGIIGMGRIGEEIAQRSHHGFHMNVLYHTRSRKPHAEEKFQATYCELDDLLAASDFVVLMTPLTKETKGMLGAREFSFMKKSAIFINGSRGQTIIEKDLIAALEAGEIRAAGLDVFDVEPVEADNPLLTMPQVVTLPHIGSSTYQTELAMSELAVDNLLAGLNGERPMNLLNEAVWNKA